jgi:hypothetical protein
MENKDYVDDIENYFVNMYANNYSLEDLNEIKEELIKQKEDTKIIDKAILMKENYRKKEIEEEKEMRRKVRVVNKAAFFSGLLGGLTSGKKLNNDLTSWEMQELINNDLEENNFEEEITDDDDFYNEDTD